MVTFIARLPYAIVRAISFYDLQEFHLMTEKFHFMTDKFHLMTQPTTRADGDGSWGESC
jgi:hypothetical protein